MTVPAGTVIHIVPRKPTILALKVHNLSRWHNSSIKCNSF
jgi:hypothetical protein